MYLLHFAYTHPLNVHRGADSTLNDDVQKTCVSDEVLSVNNSAMATSQRTSVSLKGVI